MEEEDKHRRKEPQTGNKRALILESTNTKITTRTKSSSSYQGAYHCDNDNDKDTFDIDLAPFRLPPGSVRNPDYSRSHFIRHSSNELQSGAIRAAQIKQREGGRRSFPTDAELITRLPPNNKKGEILIMSGNGLPTTYLRAKEGANGATVDLDEDLRRKVQSLRINDTPQQENQTPEEPKSQEDWKDELPIHLKSLKFMIGVMNERHIAPQEFASSSLRDIPAPIYGPKFRNMEILNDSLDCPLGGNYAPLLHPGGNVSIMQKNEARKTREDFAKCRRRTKSAEPDLSSYRNETPLGALGRRGLKHNDASYAPCWYNKRRSVDLGGVFVVEEITEEEEPELQEELNSLNYGDNLNNFNFSNNKEGLKITKGVGGMPTFLDNPQGQGLFTFNGNNTSSPSAQKNGNGQRIRRDLWNISPISEDFSESPEDKEFKGEEMEISSTNATIGDYSIDVSLQSRLNCSSPILAHSPSLRNTPKGQGELDKEGLSTPTGPAQRKVRNITRLLDDISDREESSTPEQLYCIVLKDLFK